MEFYMHFQHKHPEIIIGKRAFDAQHPFIVKKMKEHDVCGYIYQHVIQTLLEFIMNHKVTTIVMRFVNLLVLKALMDVHVVVLYM
jgi:hypothetical protein